jgi:predicted flap endonuclease-1-like 5' DNA nuclease
MPYVATEKWPPRTLFGGQRYKPGDPVPAEHVRTARALVSRGWLKEVVGVPAAPPAPEDKDVRQAKALEARAAKVRAILAEAGFDTAERIAAATDEELTALKGIGQATVKQIRAGELEV